MPTWIAEIIPKGEMRNKSQQDIEELVIEDVLPLGIINSTQDIAETDIKLIPYIYPIPTVGLDPFKEYLIGILERYRLFLFGRNGRWDYINMDGVMKQRAAFVNNNIRFMNCLRGEYDEDKKFMEFLCLGIFVGVYHQF